MRVFVQESQRIVVLSVKVDEARVPRRTNVGLFKAARR